MSGLKMVLCSMLLGTMLMVGGCQQPGKVVATVPSLECPYCQKEIVTSSIKGMDIARFVCPTCGKEFVPTQGTYDEGAIAYYCPTCHTVVAVCPSCCSKAIPPAVLENMRDN